MKPLVCDLDRRRVFYPVIRLSPKRTSEGKKLSMVLVASDPRTAAKARAQIKRSELAFEKILEQAHVGRSKFAIVARNWCRSL